MDDTSTDSRDNLDRLIPVADSSAPDTGPCDPRDEDYFDSYASSGIHRHMILDGVRTDAYREAIIGNPQLFEGKTVLDVGCGTGILSLFAADAGAARVYAVDQSDIVDQAQQIVAANGRSDVIEVIRGKVEDIEIAEEVDVIISEWMGFCLLYECMLDSVLVARDRFLKPGGILMPDMATISVRGIDDNTATQGYLGFWDQVYGYDMGNMKEFCRTEPLVEEMSEEVIVTTGDTVFDIDIATVTKEELAFSAPFELEVSREATLNAVTCSFDVLFTHGQTPVVLPTGPHSKVTHWKQTTLYLEETLAVEEGGVVSGTIACRPAASNPRGLDLAVECGIDGHPAGPSISRFCMR